MELQHSSSWNSEEMYLVKGKHLTQDSTNKKTGVMKDEGCEGRTDANLDIIMQLPGHINYLLSPPHMFIFNTRSAKAVNLTVGDF
jgi:hypothetical protein